MNTTRTTFKEFKCY
nr:unnamed protein product [Callosobruchus analis]